MFRQSIFLGLMLVLGSVLVYLILSARKEEKQVAARPREITRDSKPTATRVVSPSDLEVVSSGMKTKEAGEAAAAGFSARHDITLRSTASVPYGKLMLSITYQTSSGIPIDSRSHAVTQIVPPGGTVRLPEIETDNLPRRPAACRILVSWADLEP